MRLHDRIGERYGRLLVLSRAANTYGGRHTNWVCQCDCGRQTTVDGQRLTNGGTQSCGCLHREIASSANITHGATRRKIIPPEYESWCGAKSRCFNPKDAKYPYYGGRGITMCAEWRDDYGRFIRDMGPRPSDQHSLDRIDTNGPYAPDNCRWADRKQQAQNKANNVLVEYQGEPRVVLREVARRANVCYLSLYHAVVVRHGELHASVARLQRKGSRFP